MAEKIKKKTPVDWLDGGDRNTTTNSAAMAPTLIGEEEQDQPQENIGCAEIRDGILFQNVVLRLADQALAEPVLQQFASG